MRLYALLLDIHREGRISVVFSYGTIVSFRFQFLTLQMIEMSHSGHKYGPKCGG